MSISHTPGPFHVESGEPLMALSNDGGPAGWFVCHPKTECDSTALCFVENEADANRIALALNCHDDMLAALESIRDAGIGGYLTPELCAHIVTEAISKATSRQPEGER